MSDPRDTQSARQVAAEEMAEVRETQADAAAEAPTSRWYAKTPEEALAEFGVTESAGLTAEEAARRLAQYGPNRLKEKEPTPKWRVFLGQFEDFMIYVLLGAVIISAIEGQWIESIAILAILLLNGVLGFVQEYRAEQALEALKKMSAATASVIRDGAERDIPTEMLVPGDIVVLEAGDTIPADGRLLTVGAMRTVESALTGESDAVRKSADAIQGDMLALGDQRNTVFSGTTVSVGRAVYVVTKTGQNTEMGKIAELLAQTEEGPTPIQIELERVGKRIATVVLVIAALVFVEEFFISLRGETGSLMEIFGHASFQEHLTEGLLVAVSLAVAAIPEGLPAIVTVALSLGVRRMAERNAIVKRLHAVETLGSTTFICSDKTGTLTLNRMSVRRILVGIDRIELNPDGRLAAEVSSEDTGGFSRLMHVGYACNDARYAADGILVGDPTETALVAAGDLLLSNVDIPDRVGEVPFDSERKRMTTIHRIDDRLVAFVKGGVDTTLPLCTHALIDGEVVVLTDELRTQILASNDEFAAGGFRTLAFADRVLPEDVDFEDGPSIERDLTYIGIMGLQDPARPEVPAAVATAHRAGIHVAMVTGDHALTAQAIADDIGILEGEEVVTGDQLERMTDEELEAKVEHIRVYARVNPEHKIRIVSALKARGHIVAMTGDGVNDAPALKRADIGVAMGIVGTDVTREAADIVLSDDNFSTIVTAVEQGRTVFANLKKVILFLLSCNMSEVLIISLTSFFSPTAALLPLQILWINLVTDGMPALALGVDPAEPDVMLRKPRNSEEPILTASRWFQILWQGLALSLGAILMGYWVAPMLHVSDETSRTMLFSTLVLSQLLHSMTFRSETRTFWSLESLKNKWLVLAAAGSFTLQVILVHVPWTEELFQVVPLSLTEWGAVLALSLGTITAIDIVKVISGRKLRKEQLEAARG